MSKRGRNSSRRSSFAAKGQVTVFVILGIVMFVVMVFALFVSSSVAKLKIQTEANNAVDAYLASESINYYVYTCLDSAVTSSIEDLSLQGGVFYDYQGGPYRIDASGVGLAYIPYSMKVEGEGENLPEETFFNVSYSIQNRSNCDIVNTEVPQYPYLLNTSLSKLYGIYNDRQKNICLYNSKEGFAMSGFAGFNNMTRLCMLGSKNTETIAKVEFSPCYGSIIRDENRSVEHLLEQQISRRMEKCANFSVFKDDNITNLTSPVTKIIFTSESVLVETTYNLSVKIKGKAPVIVKHTFNYESKLRIVRMHNYVMSLLRLDSQDFYFNLENNYFGYSAHPEISPDRFFDEYMSVSVVNFSKCTAEECAPYKYDELLIVTDNKSKIGNRSLTYITAIKNRRPALEYIHSTAPASAYDIVVSENKELILSPQGYDPDDKTLGYTYEGWKETSDDDCKIVSVTDLEAFPGGKKISCTTVRKNMNNLTNSKLFISTKKNANYTTNSSDIGYHNVTITVSDKSGLYDFQTVRIMVIDLPNASISPIKIYSDIDPGIGSVEDPFNLNSSGSTLSTIGGGIPEQTKYIWKIYRKYPEDPEEVFYNITRNDNITVPTEIYDIENATLIQIIKPLNLSNVGKHNVTLLMESFVTLLGETMYSNPVSTSLDVKECVPHKNTADPYPYPFSKGNPFLAQHECCTNDYKLKEESAKCFETKKYGELGALSALDLSKNRELEAYYALLNADEPTTTTLPMPAGANGNNPTNDVYELSFERYCDKNRGNICAGEMERTFRISAPCTDKNAAAGESETCSGPPEGISETAAACESYGAGETFESIYGDGTGICNTHSQCSTIGRGGYDNGGPMWCTATCGGGSCTNTRNSECACDMNQCEASCDAAHPALWTGNTCSFDCDTRNRCMYTQFQDLPCEKDVKACVASENAEGITRGYCYYNVQCTAAGAELFELGAFCLAGEVIDSDTCLYNGDNIPTASICDLSGACHLSKMKKSDAPQCSGTQFLECDEYSGWTCSGNMRNIY